MTIADKLALLEQTKEAQRVKLGLPESLPFSRYHEFFEYKFDPRYLFLNGEQGVWFDPSDLSTMFQNVDGTEPITKDGDPVGLIKDKSGNGNHATQATATRRPIYRTDGNLHWLEFDGVDDRLEWESRVIGTSVVIACSSYGSTHGVLGGGGNNRSNGYLSVSSVSLRYRTDTTETHVFTEAQTGTCVYSTLREDNGDVYAWRDGEESTDIFNKWTILLKYISPGNVSFYKGSVYGVAVSENLISRQQRAELEQYLANKAGVTL